VASNVLFVFEGEIREHTIFQCMSSFAIREVIDVHLVTTYCTNIYDLFRQLDDDPDLDLVELVRERSTNNSATLSNFSRDDIAEIYLIFDFDAHADPEPASKIRKLLRIFSDETDVGKLFVNYPMAEAFGHVSNTDSFHEAEAVIAEGRKYKALVDKEQAGEYRDISKMVWPQFKELFQAHCKKAQYIINGDYRFPNELLDQPEIFEAQEEKYIKPKNAVAVLSAFPLFLLHYRGPEKLKAALR
jgi:hypothetical protein